MKKTILIFMMLSSQFCFGQTIDSVMVSHCTYISDFTDTTVQITVDSFNVNGLLINTYIYDTSWNALSRTFCTYSGSDLLVYQLTQAPDTSQWTTYTEILKQYDLNDSLIESYVYNYQYYQGVLTDTTGNRESYSRDTINHSMNYVRYHYVDSTNSWLTDFAKTYYYDSLNRTSLQIDMGSNLIVLDTIWYSYLTNDSLDYYLKKQNPSPPIDHFQYIYNLQDYLMQVIDSSWNQVTQTWHAISLNQYYRDTSNNITAYTHHIYLDTLGTLDPCPDTSYYQYNSSNQEIYHWTHYCGFGGSYGNLGYDSIGNLTHEDHCGYGGMGNQNCTDCDYSYFTYPFTTGIQLANNNQPTTITIFPNPTGNTFTVRSMLSNKTSLIQILNPLGEVVYEEKLFGRNEYVIHSNLSSGIYFVNVSDGEKNVVRKLIVE